MPACPNCRTIARTGLAALFLALFAAGPLGAQVVTRQVTIRVVTEAEGSPLAYAVVSVPELRLERFTSEQGAIAFPMPIGIAHRVIVKRLGFLPKDTSINVTSAAGQMVRIALRRLSIALTPVTVVDWPACKEPGIPRRDVDSVAYGVVEQIRQNAERYALLTREYPFIYASERILSHEASIEDGVVSEVVELTDTLLVNGSPTWNYHPGNLLSRRTRGLFVSTTTYAMRLPTIFHLGEIAFLANHCYHVAGVEDKQGQPLLRVDIVAAESLKDPDVNIAVWLDTTDFRMRFATIVLTRPPRQMPFLERVKSEVSYLDLIPFVPVGFMTFGENVSSVRGENRTIYYERQQVLDVRFTGEKPEGFVPTPPPPKRRPR